MSKGPPAPDPHPGPVLTYCTNVHPGESLEQVQSSLERFALPLRERLVAGGWQGGGSFPVGLYLSAQTVGQLERPAALPAFRDWLAERSLRAVTLNCFPFGGFHDSRVKHEVYRPDWREETRERYSVRAAQQLAELLPEGGHSAISTLAGTYKGWGDTAADHAVMARRMIRVAAALARIGEETGREIVLCLEPEPRTTLETSLEVVRFFEEQVFSARGREAAREAGLASAGAEEILRRFLGVCYDTCHQAVEFEGAAESVGRVLAAGVRIGKVQLSSALALERPADHPEGMRQLARFDEPRYLHQCVGRRAGGGQHLWDDLPEFLAQPREELGEWEEVRTHFHVPVHLEHLGDLATTRPFLLEALAAVVGRDAAQILEVETYTFPVLPDSEGGRAGTAGLVEALESELRSMAAALAAALTSAPRGSS